MIKKIFLILSFILGAPYFVGAAAMPQLKTACSACTSIHICIDNDHPNCIQALVESNQILVNQPNDSGMPPLHYAAAMNRPACVNRLLWEGASIEATDPDGKTVLHWITQKCVNNCLNQVLAFLRNAPPRINIEQLFNARDGDGQTALHYAAQRNDQQCTDLLLVYQGIDVSIKDNRGKTALHEAATCADQQIISSLLKRGANPNEPDAMGKTPLQLVKEKPHLFKRDELIGIFNDAIVERGFNLTSQPTQPPTQQNSTDDKKEKTSGPDTKTKPDNIPTPKNEGNTSVYAAGVGFLGLVILAIELSEMYAKTATRLAAEKEKESNPAQKENGIPIIEEDIPTLEILIQMWQTFKAKQWSKKKAFITGSTLTLGGFGAWAALKIKG